MRIDELLTAAVLVLGASAAAILVFRRAGFGSVLGLLFAGILLGPHTPGPVVDIGPVGPATELGVVLLLFTIGLELEPARLWAMRRMLFGLGTLQVLATGLALTAAAVWLGRPWQAALLLGFGLALSSTAFVMQLLAERGELTSEHGRTALAILLLQDMAVVPLLAMVPLLAPGAPDADPTTILERLVVIGAALAFVVALGRLLLPMALALAARQRNMEAFAVLAATAALLAAWVTHEAGLSPALGGFVMGVLLSGSPFHHQISAEVTPFKSLLLGLFFVSVGMSVDLFLLFERWPSILTAVLLLIVLKGLLLLGLCRLFGLKPVPAVRTALLMTQGGEFGFVLFGDAVQSRIMGAELYTTALLVISLSMAATPFLARLGEMLGRRLPSAQPGEQGLASEELDRHVLVAGYGRVGRTVAAMLEQAGIGYVALDLDPLRVSAGRETGQMVVYGDASEPRLLEQVGAGRAAAVVVSLDNPSAVERIVASVRSLYPALPIVARAHDQELCGRLERLGADVVVLETLELSLGLGEATLRRVGADEATVRRTVDRTRERHGQQTT